MGMMSVFEIIMGVLIILVAIAVVVLVLFQESPKGSGVSALTGADSYYNKNQGRTLDAKLSRFTKFIAVAFFLLTVAVNIIPRFL